MASTHSHSFCMASTIYSIPAASIGTLTTFYDLHEHSHGHYFQVYCTCVAKNPFDILILYSQMVTELYCVKCYSYQTGPAPYCR